MITNRLDGSTIPVQLAERDRVCDAVARIAVERGDSDAVIYADEHLNYSQLLARVTLLRELVNHVEEPLHGGRVGVLGHRTVLTPVAMFAAHLAGHPFVVLDPAAPAKLMAGMVTDVGVHVTVDPRDGHVRATGVTAAVPADEAYVLFTSGSTGAPRGVSVSQRNLAVSTAARLEVYRGFGTPRFLLPSPFHFDSSMAGIWGTLAVGGALVVAREDERLDPCETVALINRHRITHVLAVPNLYTEILHAVRADGGGSCASLRVAICAGEHLPQDTVRLHFDTVPGVTLINEYGPTECTVWSTYKRYDRPGAPRSACRSPVPW